MKLEFLNKIAKNIRNKKESTFVYEEKIYKDGELHIKREIKHGADAEKEIQKHSLSLNEKISKLIDDFFTDFWK